MDIILKQQETISRRQTVPRETLERNNCVRSTLLFGLAFPGSWEGSATDCYSTTCHPHIQQYIRNKKQTKHERHEEN